MGRSAVDPISKNENEFRQRYRNSLMISQIYSSRCRHFSKPRQTSEPPRLLEVALDLTLATSWKGRPSSSVKSSSPPTFMEYAFRMSYQRYETEIKFSFRKISYQEWRNLSNQASFGYYQNEYQRHVENSLNMLEEPTWHDDCNSRQKNSKAI